MPTRNVCEESREAIDDIFVFDNNENESDLASHEDVLRLLDAIDGKYRNHIETCSRCIAAIDCYLESIDIYGSIPIE